MTENENVIEVCKDFVLSVVGFGEASKTTLTVIAPLPGVRKQLVFNGDYHAWLSNQWDFARRLVRQYYKREDLYAELKNLEEQIRKQQIEAEFPVVDDDAEYPPQFRAAHSLEVHTSKTHNHIYVYGQTYNLRDELKKLGFAWDPRQRVWHAELSDELLQKITELVKKHNQKADPVEKKMSKCPHCGRWVPPLEKFAEAE